MGIMDFIKGELIDLIEWTDDSRDTLSYRYPDEDKAIKNGAVLIVRESQVAQFMYLGQFGDTFGPGKHALVTDNIPVLTKLQSWKYGFNSPFKADVYYINTQAVHRQQVGHGESRSWPATRTSASCDCARTAPSTSRSSSRSCSSGRWPARTSTSASTNSPTPCARAW